MEKYIEVTGKTEDAAISAGLAQLGLDRDSVSVEILERAKTGFLGIGSSPARVKITYEAPTSPPRRRSRPGPQAAPAEQPQEAKSRSGQAEAPARSRRPAPPPAPKAAGDRTERIVDFLTGLMEHLDNDARPQVTLGEDGSYQVELVGSDLAP